jgi:hypothetical protein
MAYSQVKSGQFVKTLEFVIIDVDRNGAKYYCCLTPEGCQWPR